LKNCRRAIWHGGNQGSPILAAAAAKKQKGDDDDPNDIVVKQVAKTVVHIICLQK
jgi:hypothetical protein